jgi:hypothetical protein
LPLQELRLLRAKPVVRRTHLGRRRQTSHLLLQRGRNVGHIRAREIRRHEVWVSVQYRESREIPGKHASYCFVLLIVTVNRLESSPHKVTLRTSRKGNRSRSVPVAKDESQHLE